MFFGQSHSYLQSFSFRVLINAVQSSVQYNTICAEDTQRDSLCNVAWPPAERSQATNRQLSQSLCTEEATRHAQCAPVVQCSKQAEMTWSILYHGHHSALQNCSSKKTQTRPQHVHVSKSTAPHAFPAKLALRGNSRLCFTGQGQMQCAEVAVIGCRTG